MSRTRHLSLGAVATAAAALLGVLVVPTSALAVDVGTLSFDPATGTDQTAFAVTTSAACPAPANALVVRLTGAGFPAEGINVVGNTALSAFGRTAAGGYRVPVSQTMKTFFDRQDNPAGAVLGGEYRFVVDCIDDFTTVSSGTFPGSLFFTSPTAYTATPPGPAAVTATATAAQAGVTVSWTAPASTGAITSYDVQVTPGRTVSVPATARTVTVPGLIAGTPVQVQVRANNAAGPGAYGPAVSATPTGCVGTPFSDVVAGQAFCTEIAFLFTQGISTGTVDPGTGAVSYLPANAVSRQAMAAFLYRTLGSPAFTPPATASFLDVPTTSPFFLEVEWLVDQGITTGFPVTGGAEFRPLVAVSRQAMSAFLYRAAGEPAFTAPATNSFSDVPVGSPFFREVEWMSSEEITTGFATTPPTYQPVSSVSRQAMAAFLKRFNDNVLVTP